MSFVYEVVGRGGEKYVIEDNGERLAQLVISGDKVKTLLNPGRSRAPITGDKI